MGRLADRDQSLGLLGTRGPANRPLVPFGFTMWHKGGLGFPEDSRRADPEAWNVSPVGGLCGTSVTRWAGRRVYLFVDSCLLE